MPTLHPPIALCAAIALALAWFPNSCIGKDTPDTMSHSHRPPLPSPDIIASLPPDGGPDYNRLVFSQSPYLLQHARNPVDWYPWGEEAFAHAREQDKPVFLSVGYSTCHWCHVMERESFEDQEVADLLNEHFVCVKVDREERPDVDKIYMDVTQALTGRGGWPMTVVLTPERKPFFAGTYFPKHGRFQQPGMMDLLPQLATAWQTRREDVLRSAEEITAHLQSLNVSTAGEALDRSVLDAAFQQLRSRYDARRGGFGDAPKFPTPHNLSFLVRYATRTGNREALDMAVNTLTHMRMGGIFDHVGYGFHRYSTDAEWLLPHFEKMLYDQALIALAGLDAYQATGDPLLARTVHEIFTYVLRDMAAPEGGFYSAEDADSEGEEGKFYVWTTSEVEQALEPADAATFIRTHHLDAGGNFTHEVGGHGGADNIPHRREPPTEDASWDPIRRNLFAARAKRIHPFKDDKILTDWNGLMIAALARGAQVLDEPAYAEAAARAADFVLERLQDDSGRLLKRYRRGNAGQPAHLEDYSFMVWGLLNLYEATFDPRYLREAIRLNQDMMEHFWDPEHGGFFLTADDGEKLLVRGKELYDGALPSGNSVALLNLGRLSRLTGNPEYQERAQQLATAFSGMVSQSPSAFTQFLSGLDFALGPTFEIVVTGKPDQSQDMLKALQRTFLPNAVVLFLPEGTDLTDLAPYTAGMTPREGKPTAYVCREFTCQQPTTDIDEMLGHLKDMKAE